MYLILVSHCNSFTNVTETEKAPVLPFDINISICLAMSYFLFSLNGLETWNVCDVRVKRSSTQAERLSFLCLSLSEVLDS